MSFLKNVSIRDKLNRIVMLTTSVALLLAALCAKGESVIDNAQSIDRGYERLDHELRRLGADITRIQ